MPDFKTAVVIQHHNPASTFHIIKLQPSEPLDFQPGQYISVKVADAKINNYSIASLPGLDTFTLIIDTKPGHEGSYYFQQLRVEEQIQYLGPFGKFLLHPDDGSSEIIFLATGSGISPIKAMIEHLLYRAKETRPIKLYFGLRNCPDIFMHDFFEEMDNEYDNFTFIPCLSRPDENWKGQCGHITELLKQDYQDGSHLSAYLCGNEAMITEAIQILKQIDTPEDRIYHEKFY